MNKSKSVVKDRVPLLRVETKDRKDVIAGMSFIQLTHTGYITQTHVFTTRKQYVYQTYVFTYYTVPDMTLTNTRISSKREWIEIN